MSVEEKRPIDLATEAVTTLFRPGDVVELRILGTRNNKKTGGALAAGYFDDHAELAKRIVSCSDGEWKDGYAVEGCYVTLNPVQPAVLARYQPNKMRMDAPITTADKEILRRRYLLVDCDPERLTGISSTDEEKAKAAVTAQKIKEHLTAMGWPLPIEADSGNGFHLLYRVDLPNNDEVKELVRRCLLALAARFDTPDVKVDKSVFNASRITKAYSSVARKGADAPQIGRPHRRSKMLTTPAEIQTVNVDLLQALAAEAPAPPPVITGSSDSSPISPEIFEAQLDAVGVTHSGASAYDGGFLWHPDECVFDPNHVRTSIIVGIRANGAFYYKCSHNSCQGLGWKEFRAEVERRSGKKMKFRESGPREIPDNLVNLWINSDPQALAAWNGEGDPDAALTRLATFLRARGVGLEQCLRIFESSPLKAIHDAQVPEHVRSI